MCCIIGLGLRLYMSLQIPHCMLLHFVLTIVAVARAAACVGSAALCIHVLCYLQWHAEDAGVLIVVAVFL